MKRKIVLEIETSECGGYCGEKCQLHRRAWRGGKGRTCESGAWNSPIHDSRKGPRPRDPPCIKAGAIRNRDDYMRLNKD